MDTAHLVAFNVTLLVAFLSPGPAMLYALRNTLRGGLAAGIVTGAGLALVAAAWTAAALMGLAAVFAVVPWLYGALKLGGAVYLIWLAVTIWRDARTPLSEDAAPAPMRGRALGRALGRAFAGGALVNLANPKSVLFAGAVLVVIFPAGLSVGQAALVVANHFMLEVVGYGLIAWALSQPVARAGYLRAKRWIDRLSALVLGALGLRLLLGNERADVDPLEGTA
ncbi:MAG: LysE family translocator [Alkalilacustris sp.]